MATKRSTTGLFEKLRAFGDEEQAETKAADDGTKDGGSETEADNAATKLALTLPVQKSATEVVAPAGAEGGKKRKRTTQAEVPAEAEVGKIDSVAAAQLAKRKKLTKTTQAEVSAEAEVGKMPLAATQPANSKQLSPSEAIQAEVSAEAEDGKIVPVAATQHAKKLSPSEAIQRIRASIDARTSGKKHKVAHASQDADPGQAGNATAKAEPEKKAGKKAGTTKATAKPPKAENAGEAGEAGKTEAKLVLGCSRCRGSQTGCPTCLRPEFNGRRFGSREAWAVWYNSKDAKLQKDKKAVSASKAVR